jgi:hypothetical protein
MFFTRNAERMAQNTKYGQKRKAESRIQPKAESLKLKGIQLHASRSCTETLVHIDWMQNRIQLIAER